MNKRAIGLELTDRALYVVEIKQEFQQIYIQRGDVVNLPSDVIVAGEIKDLSVLCEIASSMVKTGITYREVPVMLGISGLQAFIRKLSIPKVPVKELDQIVRWEGENILPYRILEVVHSYQILKHTAECYEVLFVALHKDRLNPYLQLVNNLNVPVEYLTLQPFGIVNYLQFFGQRQDYRVILARVRYTGIDLIVLWDGEIELVRTVVSGGLMTSVEEVLDFFLTELHSTLEHFHASKDVWINTGIFFGARDWLSWVRAKMPDFHWRHVSMWGKPEDSPEQSVGRLEVPPELSCAFGLSLLGVKR